MTSEGLKAAAATLVKRLDQMGGNSLAYADNGDGDSTCVLPRLDAWDEVFVPAVHSHNTHGAGSLRVRRLGPKCCSGAALQECHLATHRACV